MSEPAESLAENTLKVIEIRATPDDLLLCGQVFIPAHNLTHHHTH
jgi:hypothetical protein